MQGSIESDTPFIDSVKNLIIMAENNDLSSREIESYTAKITEQATPATNGCYRFAALKPH